MRVFKQNQSVDVVSQKSPVADGRAVRAWLTGETGSGEQTEQAAERYAWCRTPFRRRTFNRRLNLRCRNGYAPCAMACAQGAGGLGGWEVPRREGKGEGRLEKGERTVYG